MHPTLFFTLDRSAQGLGIYLSIGITAENGAWLGSIQFSPYASNQVSIIGNEYATLNLPTSTAGYEYRIEMLSVTSSLVTITSRSSSENVQASIQWMGDGQPAHRISFFCMNYDWMPGSEYIQMADLQVIPGAQGQWQSDTVYILSSASQDQDTDGMPDDWESTHGLNTGANDAGGDLDGDGISNGEEYAADTHPANSNSMLRINQVTFANNSWHIDWQGGSNAQQIIQSSTDLSGWTDLVTNSPPTPVSNQLIRSDSSPTNRFYIRVKARR